MDLESSTDLARTRFCPCNLSTLSAYACVTTIILAVFGLLPWGIIELRHLHFETHVQAWFAAGIFVALAVPITLFDVAQHLRNWQNPNLQRHVVRVILMVPIYAIDAWLALRFPNASIYLDTAKDCYEAYVIYNFYIFLLAYLQQRPDFKEALNEREDQKHVFPFCCLPTWKMGLSFINYCTHGVTSYVIIRLLTTFVAFWTAIAGVYGDGDISVNGAYAYLMVINGISQAWAMYCLILFYFAFKDDLKPMNPVGKFLSIKAVIFLTFWQSVLIAILAAANVIKADPTWTTYNQQNVAAGLQDFIICIEMFFAACVHHFVFSYKEHLTDDQLHIANNRGVLGGIKELFDVRDVAHTVADHIHTVATLEGRIPIRRNRRAGQQTALINNTSESTSLLSSSQQQPQTHGSVDL